MKRIVIGTALLLGALVVTLSLMSSAEDEAKRKQRERRDNPIH